MTIPPAIGTAEVRLRRLTAIPIDLAWTMMSDCERARARRYSHPQARDSFVAGRAVARVVLGRVCGVPPGDLVIAVRGGKLYLPRNPDLHFSLSRSAGWVAVAIARMPVGVDIELADTQRPIGAIVSQFFHAREKALLAELSGRGRRQAFYRLWTQKEAVAKALGRGLELPLDSFRVEPEGGPVHFESDLRQRQEWSSVTLDALPGYSLSLAAPHHAPEVRITHETPLTLRGVPTHERRHAPAPA